MNFRFANSMDIEKIIELRRKLLIEEAAYPEMDISKEFRDYLNSELNKRVFVTVAEDNDEIISTSAVIIQKYPPSFGNPQGLRAYVTNVYTEPCYRRKGINTKLLDLLLLEVTKQNISYVWLWSTEKGIPMYKKYGFKDVETFATMELLI